MQSQGEICTGCTSQNFIPVNFDNVITKFQNDENILKNYSKLGYAKPKARSLMVSDLRRQKLELTSPFSWCLWFVNNKWKKT